MTRARLAARTATGPLHIVTPTRTGYDTACFRTLGRKSVRAVYDGRDRWGRRLADVAWQHERVCADCDQLKRRGTRALLRITGW